MMWAYLLMLLASALAVDYYEVLGVSRDATERELKKAYRSLSRQHHPDKNRGDESSAKKFIEISEAYEILSDPEKRRIFDQYGEAGLNGQAQGGFGMHQDPMDLFQHFFGGGGFNFQQGVRRGSDTMTVVHADLVSLYNQEKLEIGLQMKGLCDECDGTGSADGERTKCDLCDGRGQRVIRHEFAPGMVSQMQTICEKCRGKGTVIKNPCPVCHGERIVDEDRKYNVFLEPHAEYQWDYVLEGEGDQGPDIVPGNLVIRVVQSRENNMGYRRRGFDLFRTEPLSAKEAQQGGWQRQITKLDRSTKFQISREKGARVYNREVEKIPGEGMPKDEHGDEHGDLYITYLVVGDVPTTDNGGHDEL